MTNSKTIKSKKSLFVLSNTNNLTNNLASGLILPMPHHQNALILKIALKLTWFMLMRHLI